MKKPSLIMYNFFHIDIFLLLQGYKDDILENHGIVKCRKSELAQIPEKYIVYSETSSLGAEVLVNDRYAVHRACPELLPEAPCLEDIMLYYVKRG